MLHYYFLTLHVQQEHLLHTAVHEMEQRQQIRHGPYLYKLFHLFLLVSLMWLILSILEIHRLHVLWKRLILWIWQCINLLVYIIFVTLIVVLPCFVILDQLRHGLIEYPLQWTCQHLCNAKIFHMLELGTLIWIPWVTVFRYLSPYVLQYEFHILVYPWSWGPVPTEIFERVWMARL